jgi:hypothetical protein
MAQRADKRSGLLTALDWTSLCAYHSHHHGHYHNHRLLHQPHRRLLRYRNLHGTQPAKGHASFRFEWQPTMLRPHCLCRCTNMPVEDMVKLVTGCENEGCLARMVQVSTLLEPFMGRRHGRMGRNMATIS